MKRLLSTIVVLAFGLTAGTAVAGRVRQVGLLAQVRHSGPGSVAGGTGRYAGLKGGGGFVAVIDTSNFNFSFRYEGLVTR